MLSVFMKPKWKENMAESIQSSVSSAKSSSGSSSGSVLSYPDPSLSDKWHYTNFVQIKAFNYGTNKRTLDTIIQLPLPEDLSVGLNPSWSMEKSPAGFAMDQALQAARSIKGSGILENIFNMAGTKNGFLLNPYHQLLFKYVNLRTLDLSWNLSPKAPEDSATILKICNLLKYYSLPSLPTGGGIVMSYPSEFDIAFLFNFPNEESASKARSTLASNGLADTGSGSLIPNPNLFKMDRCVITSIVLNYAPAGAYSNFYNGAPIEVNLQISFQEIYMLTRNKFMEIRKSSGICP